MILISYNDYNTCFVTLLPEFSRYRYYSRYRVRKITYKRSFDLVKVSYYYFTCELAWNSASSLYLKLLLIPLDLDPYQSNYL